MKTVVLNHFRHRWTGEKKSDDDRVLITVCGKRFVVDVPEATTIHRPATRICSGCQKES